MRDEEGGRRKEEAKQKFKLRSSRLGRFQLEL